MLRASRLVDMQKAVAPATFKLLSTSSRSGQVDPIHRTPKKDPPTRDETVKKEYKLDAKD
ncbi:hypothetical protein AAVH_24971 [Aphelenchoides avenae]|nr:hypothetical protein AAVH_24971 [Aphelenchus avenae]